MKLVMLSIGGNDLGFASIIAACLQAYVAKTGPCEPSQQPKIDAKAPQVRLDVGKAIAEIRAVMAQAGYANTDYRLILQTYPSVAPRAAELRYPESGPERTANGCPFYDQDATWARDRAAAQIGAVSKAAAGAAGVETLDLLDAFQGHEFCSKTSAQSTPFSRPLASGAEWGRFLGGSTVQQGELQEAFHPNAYGQRALGACVTRAFAAAPGTFRCSGGAGMDPAALPVARVTSFPRRPRITSCLAARSSIGRKGIGRLGLGVTRRRLLASRRLASISALSRSSRRYRYCVKTSKGSVTAVFGRRTKVELLLATAGRYGNRRVVPGSRLRTAKRRFRGLTRVKGTGVYRLSRRSRRILGVRRGRVKYVGVASKRVVGSRRLLRIYVGRAFR